MSFKVNWLFIICLLTYIYSSHGQACQMENVNVWQLPIDVEIEDYHDGIILQRSITNIQGYSVTSYDELNGGPYVDISIADSMFILRTNEAYRQYEENETSDMISLTFTFSCTGGTNSLPLNIRININDNNNNPPLFKTEDTAASAETTYDFTIAPPVPPGFLITDCVRDIIVRDIDLTTYRIDFGIDDNPYIEIEYDEASSTVDKEFKAILRTTTFIRSIPEPIVLRISATDVDETNDPSITTYTTVTIHGSSEFELPADLVFTATFYIANYSENDQVSLEQPIILQQGYDDYVEFTLEGDYRDHFDIVATGNLVTLNVASPLPPEALRQAQIYLAVHATRQYTSGASATVVVQLPEAVNLEFQLPVYEGQIVDNILQLPQLILSQGYQGSTVSVTVEDYPSFFTALTVGNVITLSMTPLDANIIEENNFITVRVTASTDYSSASTIAMLEIIKDDIATPVFGRPLYSGTYDSIVGLTLEPLLLVQGHDETVQITFSGEYEDYFELVRDGSTSTLRVIGAGLPAHVLSQQHLLLSVEASKPRTVGASTVVSVTLPGARELQFEAPTYSGYLQDNILTLETIILNIGYDEDVTFSLLGDYSTSFTVSNVQNRVTITLPTQLPHEVISENNFLMLTVTAVGLNALPTTTAVLLEIIKDDVTTPVFNQAIYYGNYLGALEIDIENINLVQGYDSSVLFRIEGENSQYFQIIHNGENNVMLTVQSNIPEDVILDEKVFVFNIFADKPLTVGANAAISIKFSQELTEPTVMQFAKNAYTGSLEDNILTMENIILEIGFAVGTQFHLSGDYATSFTTTVTNNLVQLSLSGELSADILENNKFIVLELEARRERAVSVFTSVIIDLVQEETPVTPVFSQAFYSGVYTEENILQFQDTITLLQGYDKTVTFGLQGEFSAWFTLVQDGNSASLITASDVPQDVLDNNHQLLFTVVAYKPNAISGESAISIALPKEVIEQDVLLFAQSNYEGQIDGSNLQVPTITLMNENTENVAVELTGDHAAYFTVSYYLNTVHVELLNSLPPELILNNEFLVLVITASKTDAVSGHTTLILSIVKEPPIVTPVFEQAYYTGEFSEEAGLLFEHTIRLIQGFDGSVSFTLEGDGSEWFTLTHNGQNSFSLNLIEGGIQHIENIDYLIFSVLANKPGSVPAQAAVVIHFTDLPTSRSLSFSQNHYSGTIEENILTAESIALVEGYSTDVMVALSGDYADYFQLVGQGGTYALELRTNIPTEVIETNNLLIITVEANTDDTRSHATIVIELVKNEKEELALDRTYYVGSYSAASGVMTDIQINVVSGYDDEVHFTLEGDNVEWFVLEPNSLGSTVSLGLHSPIPSEIFIENHTLIYIFTANHPDGRRTRATIVVTLEGEYTDAAILGFERAGYVGTIENDVSTIEPIVLNEGYTTAVSFSLHGDLSSYFTIVQQQSSVTIVLQSAIPEQSLPVSRIVMLELRAAAPQVIPAIATIVFQVLQEEDVTVNELVFSAPYYTGQLSEAEGLVFESTIRLDEGYDQNVQFTLEGDHAQWFTLVVQGNSVTLTTSGVIPPAILANNQQLVFVVTAQKPNSNTARATVVISLIDEYTDAAILGFERASYVGTIENDVSTIEPIVLNEGYTTAVSFSLHGDLSSYFTIVQQQSSVTIVLQSMIPEQLLPINHIVMLELRAAAPQNIPAIATIVFQVLQEEDFTANELVFSAPYYTGQFSEAEGLVFESTITLDEGYDQNVQFALEGDHAQWFTLVVQGNSVTLTTSGAIPPAILANNQQLVFVVTAQKPNSNTARATVVISLIDEYTDAAILGFERASYVGTIENDVSTIEPIVLNEGYTTAVSFSLHGDLSSYFTIVQQQSSVTIVLQSMIPEQLLPINHIVMLELRAAAPQNIPAIATIVFQVLQEEDFTANELVFSAPYYTGQFSEAEGLVFESTITLDEGYDQNVQFALEGDHAQWFTLVVQGNSVTLTTSGAIPPAILANNQQLVFVVTAQKPNSNTARATVVISLIDEYTDAAILGFERASYVGTIENDVSTIEPIVLNEGYTTAVSFSLHGDLSSYFTIVQQQSSVTIVLQSMIPEQLLPINHIVMLELRAAAPQNIPAIATIVFQVLQEEDFTANELVFSAPYYTGQFSEAEGLVFESTITLDEGYDQNVQFALEGDHAQWFTLVVQGNSVTLTTSGAIPPAILANNQQLVFVVTAQKPNSNTARATVVISLIDEYTDAAILGFERASYVGTIENDVSTIEPIVLNEGYTTAVSFSLHGDLSSYFTIVQQQSSVTIVLQSMIPEQLLPINHIVMLEVRAAAPQNIPAIATIVFQVLQEEDFTVNELVFSAPYYTGQFSEAEGLVFESTITLDEGYDQNVQFALEGDHAQWFTLVVQGNSVTLTTSGAIPPAILANNQQLVFVVTAQKPNSNTARATVVISLIDEYTDAAILGFERASYVGTIENDVSTIEPIVLNEGYTTAVSFSLHGDLSSYFTIVQQQSSVTIVLQSMIPEQLLPINHIVMLELRAAAPQNIPAIATIVFQVLQEEDFTVNELVFSAPYYTGQFSEAEGLVFESTITLDEGYDQNVQFALEGDHAQWFTLVVQGNSVTLTTSGAIPPAILANNQQLVFVVTAQKPNSNTARATVVISLIDEYTDAAILGFERASYVGTIENDVSTIEPIVLNEGYTTAVSFSLHGDLSSYFTIVQQQSSVTIVLQSAIPEQSLPVNRIVMLELRAAAPQVIPAIATIVFQVLQEEDVTANELVFSAPYYTGQFSEAEGLVFESTITLDEGYDQNVQFALEGDHAQWFTLVVQGNSVTLTTSGAIPPAILANNQQLVFVVTAQKPNSNTARATVVISLIDEYTDAAILGFERASYVGTIENDVSTIEPIVLNEGYTTAVSFSLHGDLSSYFTIVQQQSSVTIVLQSAIPEQSLPVNRIVMLELRAAAPQVIPAIATIVFQVLQEEDVTANELVFSAPYYTGQFSEAEGLVFESTITLDEGYDQNVQFALEGDHAQWFTLVVQGNSVTLTTSGAIPPAILANNQQLVFVVTAQKPNSNTARATVVISLIDEYTDAAILGFERASYVGTIENDVSTIEPIVLNAGYTTAVSFSLHGDLSSYFTIVQQQSSVTIVLQSAIPEQSLPVNRIVMLELRAAAPQVIPAIATIVFQVLQEEDVTANDLVFSAPYYTGQFSEAEGLVFESTITLDEGYDQNVQFALEGDHAKWFTLVVQGNSVTLTTSGAIPPAILANNQQLVFVVTAQKPNSNTARATVVISLIDEYTDAAILGFERASYVGTIENDVSTIEPIVLNEGYTTAVSFSLHGDLSSYFTIVQQQSSVTIVLQSAIPEQSLPVNRIVMLELRAAAPQVIPAIATIVFQVLQEEDVTANELVFSAPYYTGQFSEAEGLVFESTITLDEGYDQNVQFALEGDHAQWFTLVVQGNSVTLTTSGAIPPAILANNQQLVFVVTAQKPNSNTARATVVISLIDEYTDAAILGFERASYVGTIENDVSTIEPIVLNEGYTTAVSFSLHGDLSSYFTIVQQQSSVTIVLQSAIPEQSLPVNRIVMLELRAAAPQVIPAIATIVFQVLQEEDVTANELVFSAPYYTGQFSEAEGLVFESTITLDEGYDQNVQFALEGDHAQWFTLVVQGNSVTLTTSGAIPPAILANNQQLVFVVTAQKPNSNTARATVVISLIDEYTDAAILGFERASYVGTIENDVSTIEPIVLNEGYTTAVSFSLHGDLSSYFTIVQQQSSVTIVLQSAIPEQSLPVNRIVMLELRAAAPQVIPAIATIVFQVLQEEDVTANELVFSAPYYTGQFSEAEGLVFESTITLDEGYDQNVQFALEGDYASWFSLNIEGNSVTLELYEAGMGEPWVDIKKIILVVNAHKVGSNIARAVVIISVIEESGSETDVAFDKVLYEGTINLDVVLHESITITGYDGNTVEILGGYRDFFSASVSEGTVTVVGSGSLALPQDVTFVPLELTAGGASAVLLLNVIQSETPELPSVTFGSPAYVLRASMSQTGLVGQVRATASNGERVAYSLDVGNAHLQERISVNSDGEIHLSAPTNTGIYSFQVIATSIITQVQASASVQLTVDAMGTCEDDHVLPPLIILDRDEEEPHQNLVVLDSTTQPGCEFRLTNRWPLEQDWLYVDRNGLHANRIDREDPRIAFMALSQVQVELVLECTSDTQTRARRSVNTSSRLDWLGPYDYGSNKWILTDTILYDSRRSFVNLIVNDINDNYPIFVEKENEPIVVGYPVPELEEIVLPRALAELKATDADVGENAALMYWSAEETLAVAPRTGSVHVRDGATLYDDARLTVSVTDRNGQDGLTGSIQLLVKLIDVRHIAVVTVRNAFLDQEEAILSNLTAAVGYEVKVLSSAVISDDTDTDAANARNKRQATIGDGASLQLYVYGVIEREPVAVEQLSTDITENVLAGVDVTSTISLEDHLEGREIYGARDTALLVSTIILSILLFILIVAIAVWFFLKWRKARNYEQFSDANSLASRNEPLEQPPKVDNLKKPRLNLEELKRSERRLQEMLEAPVGEVAAKLSTSAAVDPEGAFDTIINMAPPDTTMPIVIQSIDRLKDDANSGDEDEFGERKNKSRRKSVVTFNENVEKIIHVEDIPDDNSSDVEVFKF